MKKFAKKLDDWIGLLLIVVVVLIVVAVSVYLEISVWNECRQTNSFWYCMRMMSKN
jgi:hypothetical protein